MLQERYNEDTKRSNNSFFPSKETTLPNQYSGAFRVRGQPVLWNLFFLCPLESECLHTTEDFKSVLSGWDKRWRHSARLNTLFSSEPNTQTYKLLSDKTVDLMVTFRILLEHSISSFIEIPCFITEILQSFYKISTSLDPDSIKQLFNQR